MAAINKEDFGEIPAGLIPRNLNQEGITGHGTHMKGGHDYPYLEAPASDPAKWDDANDEPVLQGGEPIDPDYLPPYRRAPGLLDIHPKRMAENMSVSVKIGFEILTCQLTRNPDFMSWGQVDIDNWGSYWQVTNRMIPDNAQIVEFAEEYDGGIVGYPTPGRPPYIDATKTYPPEAEFLWATVQDTKIHRWYRIKYLAYDIDDNPIVGQITQPIPIGENSTTFVKEVNYYIRNGEIGVDTLEDSRPPRPATFIGSVPNNEPAGYTDTIPPTPTTDYLWKISALRELSGDINTDVGWSIPAYVEEDIETIRFSATGTPSPGTIVGPTEDVATGTNDADLVAIGWVNTVDFDPDIHFYTATRTGSTGAWSNWLVERIRGEDGSRERVVYKLLPLTSDYDDPTWKAANTPVGVDPSNKNWLEYVQAESLFLVNFRSTAILYADGSFKRDWSAPTPFTAIDTYNDYISIHPDNVGVIDPTEQIDDTIIKRFTGGIESHDPEDLWLRSQLFKGVTDILTGDPSKVVTYQWHKIFDNGAFLGTPTDLGTTRDIKVNHVDVTGRAIFRVAMTLTDAPTYTEIADAIADGSISGNPVFTEEISIKDQVDGLDGRTLSATPTQSRFILDTVPNPDELLPSTIIVRAEVDNVDKSNIEWYYLNGANPIIDTWIQITETTPNGTGVPKYTYVNTADDLVLIGGDVTLATDIFTVVGLDDVYIKCVIPASGAFTALEDWVMISRIASSVLTAGEDAMDVHLENPYHQIRVDEQGDYITGELTKILTSIEVRKGITVQPHTSVTVAVVSVTGVLTGTGVVVVGNDGANKKEITVTEAPASWNNAAVDGSIELNVTLGAETKKVFIGLGTTLEPTGFTGLNITSDRGTFTFDYSAGGRDDIILNAALTKQIAGSGNVPVGGYLYEWTVIAGRYKTYTAGQIIVGATTEDLTVIPGDLDGSAQYQCAAYLTKTGPVYDPPFYSDSVRINDVPDASTKILYNNNLQTVKPPKPVAAYATYPDDTGGVDTWYKVTNASATWYSLSVDGGATWSEAFLLSGIPGLDGAPGAAGTPGTNGSKWLQGTTVPATGLGVIGDWYLRTTNYDIYEKTGASTWTPRGNLEGAQGPAGADGKVQQVQIGGGTWTQPLSPQDGDLWIDRV